MFCTKCGKQLPDGTRFCTGCGSPVGNNGPVKMQPSQQPKPSQQPRPQKVQQPKPAKAPKQPKEKKGGAGRIVGIIVLIILIAAAAAAAIFFLVSGSKTKINANDYLEVSLEGENGTGYAYATINYEKLIADNEKVFKLSNKQKKKAMEALMEAEGITDEIKSQYGILGTIGLGLLGGATDMINDAYSDKDMAMMVLSPFGESALVGEFDKNTGLKNGDEITFEWKVDEELLAKIYKIKIIAEDQVFVVDGLAGDEEEKESKKSLFGNNDSKDTDSEEDVDAEEKDAESADKEKSDKKDGNTDKMEIPGKNEEKDAETIDKEKGSSTSNEPATASVQNASSVSLGGYDRVSITSWTESSHVVQDGIDNTAYAAVDGDSVTSWQEDVPGFGVGEYVSYQFAKEYKVRAITFKLGNWRDAERYDMNSRPERLKLSVGGQEFTVNFPNGMTEYVVTFSKDVPASGLKVTIDSAYSGSYWDDTCISDIVVYASK